MGEESANNRQTNAAGLARRAQENKVHHINQKCGIICQSASSNLQRRLTTHSTRRLDSVPFIVVFTNACRVLHARHGLIRALCRWRRVVQNLEGFAE
jgi:hypothetical protein